ncbi:MAG: hypothetical protein U1F98_17770 [Verrucomicrobiota bacterium]
MKANGKSEFDNARLERPAHAWRPEEKPKLAACWGSCSMEGLFHYLIDMKDHPRSVPGPRSQEPVHAYRSAPAPGAAKSSETEFHYRCKNCGKVLQLAETVNYYGIPACPVCVNAGRPFEITREQH